MQNKSEKIGQYTIFLDETYFIAYAGGKRELSDKEQKQYNKILTLPFILQRKELARIPLTQNPNVVPISGLMLMSFIKELNFIPFFDPDFHNTHVIKLTNAIIYESIKQKSYELAMGG